MKNLLLAICFIASAIAVNAQDLITNIPANAEVVFTIKGKNVTDLVSVPDFENSKIGAMLLKELKQETDGAITDLKGMGLDLEASFYYFLEAEDKTLFNCFLVPLTSAEGFERLMPESKKKKKVTEGDMSYVQDRDGTIVLWTNKMLMVLIPHDIDSVNDYSYYDDTYETAIEEAVLAIDYPILTFDKTSHDFGAITEGDVVEHSFRFTNTGNVPLIISNARGSCGCTVPEYPTTPIAAGASSEILVKFDSKGKQGHQSKMVTLDTNSENGREQLTIKTFIGEEEVIEEVVIESTEVEEEVIEEVVIESTADSYYNSDDYKRREAQRKVREEKRKLRREKLSVTTLAKAKRILKGYGKRSILSNVAYTKSIGKTKDEATVWVNDLGTIYQHAIPSYSGFNSGLAGLYNFDDLYGGTSITSRLNFEEDQAKMDISYTMNPKMAKHTKAMYDGKMNANFFNYFNEDEVLGYMSVNMSMEGILKEYPKLMEDVFSKLPQEEFSDAIPIATELLSIMLDEEAIAGILRGDMLLVVNDISEREVSYTTYEYDEDYNRKEVVKTKTETLPGFLFMFTSTEQNLFNKLVKFGVKQKGLKFDDGLYRVETPRDVPFDMYMTFKDNAVILGSSKQQMTAIRNNTYVGKVSSVHKKMISKNATSMYVNGKRIVSQIPTEAYPRELRDKVAFITKNTEDMSFTAGKIKGNTISSELILHTPNSGNHKNSLAYFINMIDAFME